MAGSSYGNIFKVTTWGESHGKAIGVVIDGCPAGLSLYKSDIEKDLFKRKTGKSKYNSQRKEEDKIEILSGIFNSKTTGTPISILVFNKDANSKDYEKIKNIYRPGHADYTYDNKYGFRDYRGGGRSSGRETIARVIAGAIAKKILNELGVIIIAYTESIGKIKVSKKNIKIKEIFENELYMPCNKTAKLAKNILKNTITQNDSIGGCVYCIVKGLKCGIGEPVFEKLDANLSKAILSIGAVKGIEFGSGFSSTKNYGSKNNDEFFCKDNNINKKTNNSGGILGGISEGFEINFRVAIKPTSSISKTQNTINTKKENVKITINGRHDPLIVNRAVVVVEAMTAITILDQIFIALTSKLSNLKLFYNNL